jgi:hypothetical protein
MVKVMAVIYLGLMIAGFTAGYLLHDGKSGFVFYHIGGLGAICLFASAAASILEKKGYGYWWGFLLVVFISISLGVVAGYLSPPSGDKGRSVACGGTASLATGLICIVIAGMAGDRKGR